MTSSGSHDPISALAICVNEAIACGDAATLESLVTTAADLYERVPVPIGRASIALSRANAHSAIRQLGVAQQPGAAWEWDAPNLKQEIYWLRQALLDVVNADQAPAKVELRLRIETNLGNVISHVGRFCEALEHWDAAIRLDPKFGMALACRGDGLTFYGRVLYDNGHQPLFFWRAHQSLTAGLEAGVEDHAVEGIAHSLKRVDALYDWARFSFDVDACPLGSSKKERDYRAWCLQERLFLNPLNDLGPHAVAARDVITFPSIAQTKEEGGPWVPEVYGIYNQLTQEFVSARYLAYEAIQSAPRHKHFSDKDVLLYNTLDYRVLRLWVEKLKMSYLSAFASFDKMAYLINHYWKLGVKQDKVNFGSIWYQDREKKILRPEFDGVENWPLRGLFGISRDLHWRSDGDFPTEPQARLLHNVRNHIAHKYLAVHDDFCFSVSQRASQLPPSDLSYRISDQELCAATIKLLKLVRSALIYLSLAVHCHENQKRAGDQGLYGEMPLFPFGDDRP